MSEHLLRVATFNIHHAEGRDGIVDISRTAAVIAGLGADLIALQELDVGVPRSGGVDQPARLSELLGIKVHFSAALDLDEGSYGIGLASSLEVTPSTIELPRLGSEEPRVCLVAHHEGIGVITTHLSRDRRARALQTEEVARIAERLGPPTIVLGDMNEPAGDLAPLTARGLRPVRLRSSFLRRLQPGWQIDHILISNDLSAAAAWTVPTSASDHLPLAADIRRGT